MQNSGGLEKADSVFGGWYEDTACTNSWIFFTDTVIADNTLFAKWTAAVWQVTFNSHGGSPVDSRSVTHGDTISVPIPDPTRSGYAFQGWYRDGNGMPQREKRCI
ncbi:MAG: InlB B-repeat-containing protein [Chitinispirillaceae bacterium]|nr:InlB B-repeat-containing protein [Chitinispirillaceae bacterium]